MNAGYAALSHRFEFPSGTKLGGFGRDRAWNGVEHFGIESNVVVFAGRSLERPVALVGLDALYPNDLYRLVEQNLSNDIDLVFLASHSHFVPNLAPEFERLGSPMPDDVLFQQAKDLTEHIRALSDDALSSDNASSSCFVSGPPVLVRSRRRRGWRAKAKGFGLESAVLMMPDRHVAVQPRVLLLSALNRPDVILWSFPCHPTGFFDDLALTSEYPGLVRQELRKAFGEDVVTVFLQSASGDLRQPFSSRRFWSQRARTAVMLVINGMSEGFIRPTGDVWHNWSTQISDSVLEAARQTYRDERRSLGSRFCSATIGIDAIVSSEHPVANLSASALTISEQVGILAINGEVTSALGDVIRDALANEDKHWELATCANESVGYLATDEEFIEGGYESGDWPKRFGCASRVLSGADAILSTLARRAVTD